MFENCHSKSGETYLMMRREHLDLEGSCSQPTGWGWRVGAGRSQAAQGLDRRYGRASWVDRWSEEWPGKASSSQLLIGGQLLSFQDLESDEKENISEERNWLWGAGSSVCSCLLLTSVSTVRFTSSQSKTNESWKY